jgi:hypothetical protein
MECVLEDPPAAVRAEDDTRALVLQRDAVVIAEVLDDRHTGAGVQVVVEVAAGCASAKQACGVNLC